MVLKKWITPTVVFVIKLVILSWITYMMFNNMSNGMPPNYLDEELLFPMWGLYLPYLLISFVYFLIFTIQNRILPILLLVVTFDIFSFITFKGYLYQWLY